MNKHYLFMDLKRAVGQRYIGGAIFPKTKICLESYFWRKSKIAPISVFVAIILNGMACAPEPGKANKGEAGAGKPAGVSDGPVLFRQYCVTCHGADGTLGLNGAKDLTQSTLSLAERITQSTNGKNMMTPFRDVLSTEEIKAVAEYTLRLKK